MSASTEKKNRQAAREAGTDKKTLALEKEAQEKKKSNLRWTLGTIAVVLVVALVLLLNSGLVYKTTAFTVGSKNYSTAESVSSTFPVLSMPVVSTIFAVCLTIVIAGGLKRVGDFASKVVPFMCILYMVFGLIMGLFLGLAHGLLYVAFKCGNKRLHIKGFRKLIIESCFRLEMCMRKSGT